MKKEFRWTDRVIVRSNKSVKRIEIEDEEGEERVNKVERVKKVKIGKDCSLRSQQ